MPSSHTRTWYNVLCISLIMETLEIPCSHLFAIIKMENLETIPHCMILSQWTKKAILGVSLEVQDIST